MTRVDAINRVPLIALFATAYIASGCRVENKDNSQLSSASTGNIQTAMDDGSMVLIVEQENMPPCATTKLVSIPPVRRPAGFAATEHERENSAPSIAIDSECSPQLQASAQTTLNSTGNSDSSAMGLGAPALVVPALCAGGYMLTKALWCKVVLQKFKNLPRDTPMDLASTYLMRLAFPKFAAAGGMLDGAFDKVGGLAQGDMEQASRGARSFASEAAFLLVVNRLGFTGFQVAKACFATGAVVEGSEAIRRALNNQSMGKTALDRVLNYCGEPQK
jgi:hypothetical protein